MIKKKYQVISNSSDGSRHIHWEIYDTQEQADARVEYLKENDMVWNCWTVDVYVNEKGC